MNKFKNEQYMKNNSGIKVFSGRSVSPVSSPCRSSLILLVDPDFL